MSFQDLQIKTEYRSLQDDVVRDFYTPILDQSTSYKRAVGFFSSSALIELTLGLEGLIRNNGKIELIASPRLSEDDIAAIEDGYERKEKIIEESLMRELKNPAGRFEEARLNLLSNLIAAGSLEIKIAFLEKDNRIGMFHEKMGLMYDSENNIIAFTGSMNESANAFSNNYESIDVFTSWSQDRDRAYAKEIAFNNMWNDYDPCIKVIDFLAIEKKIIEKYKKTDNIDLLCLIKSQDKEQNYKFNLDDEQNYFPRIPKDVEMRDYQIQAICNWSDNNFTGIFDMATGTGKTYTALAAITTLYEKSNHELAVIIVCPFQHLVEQWKEDIEKFGMNPIVCYSASSQRNWKDRLKTAVTGFTLGVQKHFCVISTNATFSSDFFQNQIKSLKNNSLLVIDEAHNFGADNLSKTLLPNMNYRLALSATIDRHGDEEGTQKLYDYFDKKCIEYTLKEAIENGMLTPYYYYPIVVALNDNELADYIKLTEQIVKSAPGPNNSLGKNTLSDYTKMLLIKRARIVAGASDKITALKNAITSYQKDKHILVYCGATTMNDVDYKEGVPPVDDVRQIDIVADLLGNELNMKVSKFTSEESSEERELIKTEFADGRHQQALIAIRCLDEGVNIPSIKTAFILASSTNPKEYIQRRGRVLRTNKGKDFATIYDFITLPMALDDVENYSLEICNNVKSLAIREMVRMKDFASISENPSEVTRLTIKINKAFSIEPDEERRNENV